MWGSCFRLPTLDVFIFDLGWCLFGAKAAKSKINTHQDKYWHHKGNRCLTLRYKDVWVCQPQSTRRLVLERPISQSPQACLCLPHWWQQRYTDLCEFRSSEKPRPGRQENLPGRCVKNEGQGAEGGGQRVGHGSGLRAGEARLPGWKFQPQPILRRLLLSRWGISATKWLS